MRRYCKDLRARTGISPSLYVFREGEYQADYAADSTLTRLVGVRISAATDAEALLEQIREKEAELAQVQTQLEQSRQKRVSPVSKATPHD